jgi:hypothetical protein
VETIRHRIAEFNREEMFDRQSFVHLDQPPGSEPGSADHRFWIHLNLQAELGAFLRPGSAGGDDRARKSVRKNGSFAIYLVIVLVTE